jgi:CheY-like chemotaxis protein
MRVLLADDQSKVCAALRLLLEEGPRLSVMGEAAEAEDLLGQVEATQPDLMLSDWELPGLRTHAHLSALRTLSESHRPQRTTGGTPGSVDCRSRRLCQQGRPTGTVAGSRGRLLAQAAQGR